MRMRRFDIKLIQNSEWHTTVLPDRVGLASSCIKIQLKLLYVFDNEWLFVRVEIQPGTKQSRVLIKQFSQQKQTKHVRY